jgi:hypothetical protein
MIEPDIPFRPLHTSILDIYKVFQTLVCCLKGIWLHPFYTITLAKFPQGFGDSGSLEEWKLCHNLMVEADIHLRPLHTSIVDIYKVLELLCCLKGIWVHPYTITPAKLPLDLGIQVHLRSGNIATTSWLRLIFTSDHFINPY